MNIRRFLKSLGGRRGNATHNGTPGSHVNHSRNKRIANKAVRHMKMIETAFDEEENPIFDPLTDEEPH